MNTPDDLRYTENHEWIRYDEGTGTAKVGVTDYAQGELGDVVFVELEPEGTELEQNEPFGTVEAVKTVSELYMPVSGTILAANIGLQANPEHVNNDPYGEGWMVRIEVSDASQLDDLMTAEDYAEQVG